MISAIRKRIEDEMTPIVAFGLVALICILIFLSLSRLGDKANRMKNDVRTAQTDLFTLQQLQGDDVWSVRLQTSEAELTKMKSKIWRGSSPGVVSAYLEEALSQLLNQAETKRTTIRVDPELQQLNGIEILSFEMRGQVPSHLAVIDVMALIEGNERHIWINDTRISFNGNGAATLSATGYIPVDIMANVGVNNE